MTPSTAAAARKRREDFQSGGDHWGRRRSGRAAYVAAAYGSVSIRRALRIDLAVRQRCVAARVLDECVRARWASGLVVLFLMEIFQISAKIWRKIWVQSKHRFSTYSENPEFPKNLVNFGRGKVKNFGACRFFGFCGFTFMEIFQISAAIRLKHFREVKPTCPT